jgi:hypothetical protein
MSQQAMSKPALIGPWPSISDMLCWMSLRFSGSLWIRCRAISSALLARAPAA